MACCQDILAIPAEQIDRPTVAYLTVEHTRQLLAAPDRSTRTGRRDATLLATPMTPPPGFKNSPTWRQPLDATHNPALFIGVFMRSCA